MTIEKEGGGLIKEEPPNRSALTLAMSLHSIQ